MAEKKYQMLISIELSEINFNQPTEKGNFRLLAQNGSPNVPKDMRRPTL